MNPSTIRMLPQKDFKPGLCAVCGHPAIWKWTDPELATVSPEYREALIPFAGVGDCCYGPLVLADRALSAVKGMKRPETRKHDAK
jgi:hypothetical protein